MTCSSCNRNNTNRHSTGCRRAAQTPRLTGVYAQYAAARPACSSARTCTSCGSGGCASSRSGCSSARSSCGAARSGAASSCAANRRTGCGKTYGCLSACYPYDCCNTCTGCGNSCTYPGPDSCHPFYCGPCGPVHNDCGCTDGCTPCNPCSPCEPCYDGCADGCANECGYPCGNPVFGFFTQVGSVTVSAGGVIPFNGGSTVEGIWKDGGAFTLEEEGVYLATLTAFAPGNTALYTELDVRVNGIPSPGGTIVIDKVATDPPQNASAQTVITANSGAVVTVTSSEALNLTADDASDPIITLTLVRIG
ncbi:MAG: hypothetical protein IJE08_00370 [Clostridia bacterium]|nr:hypothetical protein [Clostridia bacterium]